MYNDAGSIFLKIAHPVEAREINTNATGFLLFWV